MWITWEQQRRNRTLSAALGAKLYELDFQPSGVRRYLKALASTARLLLQSQRQIIFAQNPSLILSLLAVWLGKVGGHMIIIDAHNAGIFPLAGRTKWLARLIRPLAQRLANHVMRMADLTIVSNAALEPHVQQAGGRSFVLPDPLPDFSAEKSSDGEPHEGITVLFICTWAADEPYTEVIEAAARINPDIRIYITGNSKGRAYERHQVLPENVVLSGFVPEQDFIRLLHEADIVMDLTTLDDCLVCGAYEAVAANTPLILSNSAALQSYFHKGVVFTTNDAESVAHAIEEAVANREHLQLEIAELEQELTISWQKRHQDLEVLLQEHVTRPAPIKVTDR